MRKLPLAVALFGGLNLSLGDVRIENEVSFGDQPEFMGFEYLRKNTLLNFYNIAKSPSMPQEVRVETRKLTNFTNPAWKAPNPGKVKGYYILMRETTSPLWEKRFLTTDITMDLAYSKDNYFFAVQSVSEDANEGLRIIPSPAGR